MSAFDPAAAVTRLFELTNAHDVEGIVSCFASDYMSEQPLHPNRAFVGNEQVRRNWTQILGLVPDLRSRIVRLVSDGDIVWNEFEHSGTRPDGSPHLMRGVNIFGVKDGLIAWGRLYMAPVEDASGGNHEAIGRIAGANS